MIKITNTEVVGWEQIDSQNYYQVSRTGEVYSMRRNKFLKQFIASGYSQVELNIDGKATKHLVHRLVAEAFIPNPLNLPCVNHIDGNKQNNSVDNLEWCSYSENMIHASKNGLLKTIGENQHSSKLKTEDVKYIKSVYKKGNIEFGASGLARKFGVDHKTIVAIIQGKTWKGVCVC